jgi:protein phosphatase 1L
MHRGLKRSNGRGASVLPTWVSAVEAEQRAPPAASAAWVERQGKRPEMEDFACVSTAARSGAILASVFDGHEGDAVSSYLYRKLHASVEAELPASFSPPCDTERSSILHAFERTDSSLRAQLGPRAHDSGSTATLALVHPNRRLLLTANTGDSLAAVVCGNAGYRLTQQHRVVGKAGRAEAERVANAGGIISDGRVNGELATSRSFGDSGLKHLVPATPDVEVHDIGSMLDGAASAPVLIVATDGLWDVLTVRQAAKVLTQCRRRGMTLQEGAEALADEAINRRRSEDNVALVVLQFSNSDGRQAALASD